MSVLYGLADLLFIECIPNTLDIYYLFWPNISVNWRRVFVVLLREILGKCRFAFGDRSRTILWLLFTLLLHPIHKMWLLNKEIVFKSNFLLKLLYLFNWKLYSVNNFRPLPLSTSTLYRVCPEYIRYVLFILAQYQRKLTESFRGFISWHSGQMQNYFRRFVTYSFVVTIHLITAPHTQDVAVK
jgi:hypothetical protein